MPQQPGHFPPPPNIKTPLVGADQCMMQIWYNWLKQIDDNFDNGLTVTITTAKLTGGGANGSMTFKHGLLVAQVQAT